MSKENELEEKKSLLETFVLNNPKLETLEMEIAGFNIFQAIGMGTQEIRHSKTLAYLLDPNEQHGLGQYFLKRVLMGFAKSNIGNVSPIDIDCGNFMDVEIRREWQHIDILIICPSEKIVVAIENKIDASEHGDQLVKYYNTVNAADEFKAVDETSEKYKNLFVFLTKNGEDPGKDGAKEQWITASHTDIVADLEYSAERKASDIGAAQKVLIYHYIDLMKRFVLEESYVAKLAGEIYAEHKAAVDFILENQPLDERRKAAALFKGLVAKNGSFTLGICKGSTVRFWRNDWPFEGIKTPNSGNFKGVPILFEADVREDFDFNIELVLANLSDADVKKRLCEMIMKESGAEKPKRTFSANPRAWDRNVINLDRSDAGGEDYQGKLQTYWDGFLNEEPNISAVVAQVLNGFKEDSTVT